MSGLEQGVAKMVQILTWKFFVSLSHFISIYILDSIYGILWYNNKFLHFWTHECEWLLVFQNLNIYEYMLRFVAVHMMRHFVVAEVVDNFAVYSSYLKK